MLRTVSTLTLGLLVLAACPGDDSSTTAGPAGTSSTGSDTEPPNTESTSGSGSGAVDSTEDSATTEGSGTTGAADACSMCVETECADQLAECMMEEPCTCFQECAANAPDQLGAVTCAMECGVQDQLFDTSTAVGRLVGCTTMSCPKCSA